MPIAQPAAGRGGIAVPAGHAGDGGGHPVAELAHGRGADRGEELITVGEVPVGGVGDHAHHSGRLAEHGLSAAEASRRLFTRGEIAATPMTGWGPGGERYLRLVFANEPLERLGDLRARFDAALA